MNIFKKTFCRGFQGAFYVAMPVLPYKDPDIIDSIGDIPDILNKEGIKRPLVVTDSNLSAIGASKNLTDVLDAAGTDYVFFDKAFPNPTTDLVERAYGKFISGNCDGLISYGGGSPMDVAKAVGIRVVHPNKKLTQLAGIVKVWKKLPPIIAIPTTAGTGSETSVTTILVDSETRHKFGISDFPLIPRYAVLDPVTIHELPRDIAASTGLDALVHALEAYINRSHTKESRNYCELAVKWIFASLKDSVDHKSEEAERQMLLASHYAGRALSRAYVGYIHAVSHSLSGMYDLPHGWTNAVLTPIVLRMYGPVVNKKLARLARCAGIGKADETEAELAEKFIAAFEEMNRFYGIPDHIDAIREEHIPRMARYAAKEANPVYPVPVLWTAEDLEEVYRRVMPGSGHSRGNDK